MYLASFLRTFTEFVADNLVTHLAPYIDKFGYKSVDVITVGAAVGFTAEQYLKVNGYSNEFAVS